MTTERVVHDPVALRDRIVRLKNLIRELLDTNELGYHGQHVLDKHYECHTCCLVVKAEKELAQ